jgi:hypothetical protein
VVGQLGGENDIIFRPMIKMTSLMLSFNFTKSPTISFLPTPDFPLPFPDFVFSVPRMLARHWPLAATADHGSPFTNCFGGVERA